MKKLKLGTLLIILGNLLYLAFLYFGNKKTSSFGEFTTGLLVGLSIGCNLIGIILTVAYATQQNRKNK